MTRLLLIVIAGSLGCSRCGEASSSRPAAPTVEAPVERPVVEPPPEPDPPPELPEGPSTPHTNAEISAPGETSILGIGLEVRGVVTAPIDMRPRPARDGVSDGSGVLISPRHFAPLEHELAHGTMDDFEPPASYPPAVLDTAALQAPAEVLVFDGGALSRIERPQRCSVAPCPRIEASGEGVLVVVPVGFVNEHRIQPGWTIAIEP